MYAPVEGTAFVANAGFNLVTLANNHIFCFRVQGFESTAAALDEINVAHVGAEAELKKAAEPYVAECHGINVAVLNITEHEWSTDLGSSAGACPIDRIANFRTSRDATQHADHLISICLGRHEMHA